MEIFKKHSNYLLSSCYLLLEIALLQYNNHSLTKRATFQMCLMFPDLTNKDIKDQPGKFEFQINSKITFSIKIAIA